MGAKWFCNNCDKEIWKELSREKKGSQTVLELEYLCFCSDCYAKWARGRRNKDYFYGSRYI